MEIIDTHITKLTKIGNSQTIRIPKRFVERFFPEGEVVIEATEGGLYITKKKKKLSYKDAAMEMAEGNENWQDWDGFQNAGIEDLGDW
ncbi:MAG: AbrB/MazE/SpoVT family DNA-binding domain-containing protein [Proteobacteria bacterium]|nr:AbrB/MazE/SpoVT family DNA-binding domain-containing protein [Pseudomonadota bacterium]